MRNMHTLGSNQRQAFHYLQRYRLWPTPRSTWVINDYSTTRALMHSLVRRGIATLKGETFHLTPGKEHVYVAKIRKISNEVGTC